LFGGSAGGLGEKPAADTAGSVGSASDAVCSYDRDKPSTVHAFTQPPVRFVTTEDDGT